jgi:hypothetical protein
MLNSINSIPEKPVYFNWLLKIIDCKSYPIKQYYNLLNLLFETDFYISKGINMDENRIWDGLELRKTFFSDYIVENVSCSILEIMIALSIKIENVMCVPGETDHTYYWFWQMIGNLHLLPMTDTGFDYGFSKSRIDIFLERQYDLDGDGGLFFIGNHIDARKIEIWQQMTIFLNNYYIESEKNYD